MKKTTKPSPRSIAVLESAELRAVIGGVSGNSTGRRAYLPVEFEPSPPPPPPPPTTNG